MLVHLNLKQQPPPRHHLPEDDIALIFHGFVVRLLRLA